MNITFDFRKPQGCACSCFRSFSNEKEMIRLMKERGEVTITASNHTKTTIETTVGIGEHEFVCAYIPQGAEHLKFHHTEHYNYFFGVTRKNDYFKITKKQGFNEYLEYLRIVLNTRYAAHLGDDFNLRVHLISGFDTNNNQ